MVGDTKIKTKHVVAVEGKIQCDRGEIRVKAEKLHVRNEGVLDASGSIPGIIAIEVNKLRVDANAALKSTSKANGGRVYIVTKEVPKLHGLLSVEGENGQGGLLSICCDQGKPILKNTNVKGAIGDGKMILDFNK